jgi:pimeloyl-ACP methyl ester carboxylesterase
MAELALKQATIQYREFGPHDSARPPILFVHGILVDGRLWHQVADGLPTARTLGVHVNTLYQRIALLDRLLGPDWRQPPRSLDLHVLLRLLPDRDTRLAGRDG